MRNLFICLSPAQILYSVEVINKIQLKTDQCDLFYYDYKESPITQYYLKKNKNFFNKINFFLINKNFPFYVFEIRKFFKNQIYNQIFLCNTEGIIEYYILSFCSFKNLNTFYEGSSNIFKINENLLIKDKIFKIFKDLIYFIFGNRYSKRKILSIYKNHYTISKNDLNKTNKNIKIKNPFSNFKNKYLKNKPKKKISVVVGTCIQDFSKTNKDLLKYFLFRTEKFILKLINSEKIGEQTLFYPHPRSVKYYFKSKKIKIVNSKLIIEDFIKKKIFSGYKVKIYCSVLSSLFYSIPHLKYNFYYYKKYYYNKDVIYRSKKKFPNTPHLEL